MNVNFDTLNKDGSRRLLSGRKNGEAAYDYCGLRNFDKDGTLVLRSTGGLVVSNSYFLGMLEKVFMLYNDADELQKHIDCTGISELNKEELAIGIKRLTTNPEINSLICKQT